MQWRKSSASAQQNCVEVGRHQWRKSAASGTGNCVEVALADDAILVRDSKNPSGPQLRFTEGEWSAFLTGVRLREFDL